MHLAKEDTRSGKEREENAVSIPVLVPERIQGSRMGITCVAYRLNFRGLVPTILEFVWPVVDLIETSSCAHTTRTEISTLMHSSTQDAYLISEHSAYWSRPMPPLPAASFTTSFSASLSGAFSLDEDIQQTYMEINPLITTSAGRTILNVAGSCEW